MLTPDKTGSVCSATLALCDEQKFSRHRDLRTHSNYDDNRHDSAGEVTALVAGMA